MSETAADLEKEPYGTPRSAWQLVRAAFALYQRFPLLFFVLATGVIVPFQVIVLAATGAGPLDQSSLGFRVEISLILIGWVLIGPLISALHVHAVAEVREGGVPRLGPIARRGLGVLPAVAAASIISGLGIALGLVLLVIPGIFLSLRWSVVAQTAAIEDEGWMAALRRSNQLTDGHYGHIFVFLIYVGLITLVPTTLIGFGFGHSSTTTASFLVGVFVRIVTSSFSALAAALLYYDLRARREAWVQIAPALTGGDPTQASSPWDPRGYSDQDRPKGWYIDPSSPDRMLYWGEGEKPGWGASTRTPRKIMRAWNEEGPGESPMTWDPSMEKQNLPPIGNSWDPRKYSDSERPKGWYIDPTTPSQMHYWGVGGTPGWTGTTRTPRKIRRDWESEIKGGDSDGD